MLNQIKTVFFLGLLTGLLLLVGQLIGGTSGLTVAFIIALLMNFFSYWFSDKIVLFMYRAKSASKKDHFHLYDLLEEVAKKANMPVPKLYIIPSAQSNAFATGRNPKHAVVAVTNGILNLLNDGELKGVLAHEMAHVKNRDILLSTIAAVIAGAISYIAFMARWAAIFGGGRSDQEGSNILELLFLAILTPFIATVVRLAMSRSREYLADSTGARIIKDPDSLANALKKLEASNKYIPMKMGSEATSHMFIVNPFSAKSLLSIFSTHPPVEKRVSRLRSMAF